MSKVAPSAMAMYNNTIGEILDEIYRARGMFPQMNSAHEGIAIIEEEFLELREHVYMKQKNRFLPDMRKEAIELAAMAVCFACEVCDEENGRK